MSLFKVQRYLKLMKHTKIKYMKTRQLNIHFKKILQQNNIQHQQHKQSYIVDKYIINLMKINTPFIDVEYLSLENNFCYIFYNGCFIYKPQWLFINAHTFEKKHKLYNYNIKNKNIYRINISTFLHKIK